MESFEGKGVNNEPNFEEAQALLEQSYLLAGKILGNHSSPEDPYWASASATTIEADDSRKRGKLSIMILDGQLYDIELKEIGFHHSDVNPNTSEKYQLIKDFETDRYGLIATGKYPILPPETDEYDVQVPDSMPYFHTATPKDIQRLAEIMVLAEFGDFKNFDEQVVQNANKIQ